MRRPIENRLPRDIYMKITIIIYIRLFILFPNLITKESYNWWVTRRVWGFRHQISKAKIFQNISKFRSHISGSFRRTPWHCAKWLRNSPGKRCQRIWICLTGEVETPSSSIRRQAPNAKYPDGRTAEQNSGCDTFGWNDSALPYPDSLREKHTALVIITPG